MPTDQRPCLIEFLWLLQKQGDVDAEHHDRLRAAFVRQHVALAERGMNRVRPADALAKRLGEWDNSGGPFHFAFDWVAKRLTCPIRDEGAKSAIDFLLGDEVGVASVLKRAIAMQGIEPKARLKLMSNDREVMEVVRQLAILETDGRFDELLRVMHDRFPEYPGRKDWPQPTGGEDGENGGSMPHRIDVKDSPGAVVNVGSSNRIQSNQAGQGLMRDVLRRIVRWFFGRNSGRSAKQAAEVRS